MVDTEPLARRVWEEVLASYGVELDEATYTRMVGRRTAESAQLLLETHALPLAAAELAAAKTRSWERVWRRGVPARPGLKRLHRLLAEREIPWAVATSSPRFYAAEILQQLEVSADCRALAAGDEVRHGKPAPDIYLLAAERLGIAAERCLALEDSVPGGRSARAAGMTLVAVPGPPATAADFPFADYVFPSLDDVATALDRLLANG